MANRCRPLLALALLLPLASVVFAQTTAGTSATIVVPVIAQTSSFGSEVTLYNPNAASIDVNAVFYDAQNTASPGPKSCTSLAIAAGRTVQFTVASQCALPSGSNFGLLVLSETTGTQRFYGYARTQTPQGIGFSTEGFPIENFNDQIQHATGLKRVAASGGLPAYQTNCFVATLGDAVSYELRLFDGGTGVQLGSTLSGSLTAFQQFRYLDVFAAAGVAAGNKTNVRAQFTNVTGNKKKLIGFCTVQENTTLSADFRIAKSYGGTPANAFVQGGNAFGAPALMGTVDSQPVQILANNSPVMRYSYNISTSPNIVGGNSNNSASSSFWGQTVSGGGAGGNSCTEPSTSTATRSCGNLAARVFATVGGGMSNQANNDFTTVAGGSTNTASSTYATVSGGDSNSSTGQFAAIGGGQENLANASFATIGGGLLNLASGEASIVSGGTSNVAIGQSSSVGGGLINVASGDQSTIPGGYNNVASGSNSFAAGINATADQSSCAVFGLWSAGVASCHSTPNVFKVMGDNGFSVDYHTNVGGGGDRWLAIGPFSHLLVPTTIITWNGAYLSDAGVWVNASSSKTRKKDFQPVDVDAVLNALARLPITTWRYKDGDGDVLHMGPMAEDFWQAFGIGYGDHTIADLDARGVEFAAIQGLHRLLHERDAEIASLRERLEDIETLLKSQSGTPVH